MNRAIRLILHPLFIIFKVIELISIIDSKESWPKGPDFGLPLKGAVLSLTN
jgi:hypothetical protein